MNSKMKLSDSELKLLICFLALLIIAGSYFLVFQRCVDKAQTIEAENLVDQSRVNELVTKAEQQKEVEQETADYLTKVDEIIAKYPSDHTMEKAISIMQKMQDETGIEISSITFLMDNYISTVTPVTSAEIYAEKAGAAATVTATPEPAADTSATDLDAQTAETTGEVAASVTDEGMNGYYASLAMNYAATYEQFKDMIVYINRTKDRMTIPSITSTFDNETGKVSGVITVNLFYLRNTGKEYEPPVITDITCGVNDIFQSSTTGISNADMNQSEEEATDAEETDSENSEEVTEEQTEDAQGNN